MTTQTTNAAMVNPFPGMNPYLERSNWWPDVHTSIIVSMRDLLASRLTSDYAVRVEQRVYVAQEPDGGNGASASLGPTASRFRVPDAMVLSYPAGPAASATATAERGIAVAEPAVGVAAVSVALPAADLERQRYLQVLRVDTMEVVAVIELLSPSNKSGGGRREYLGKRATVKNSTAHLVEIDLLRAGPPMPVIGDVPHGCYRIVVANGRLRPHADLYAFGISEAIPEFVLPLAEGAAGISVDLNAAVQHAYAQGSYNMQIDYGQDPEPPLSDDDRVWLDALLRERGLRETANAADQEE